MDVTTREACYYGSAAWDVSERLEAVKEFFNGVISSTFFNKYIFMKRNDHHISSTLIEED